MALDAHTLAKLARDVAMGIKSSQAILNEYGLTQQEYEKYEQNPFYMRALEQDIIEWNRPMSTDERIRLTMKAGLEDSLMAVCARARDPTEPLAAANEVLKLFARVSGLDAPKDQQAVAPADRFVITINMGPETIHIDKPLAVGVDDGKELDQGRNQSEPQRLLHADDQADLHAAQEGVGQTVQGRR